MPTFLELCQQFHSDVGLAGTISAVTGQVGQLKRAVGYIQKANRKIQRRKSNWKFLWSSWDLTLVQDIGDYPAPGGLGSFDLSSFWLDAGTDDARPLPYVDWRDFRANYKNISIDNDETEVFTVNPAGRVVVHPTPSAAAAGSIITAEYWRSPVELTTELQISLIPEEFHDAIVALAKVYFAEKVSNSGLYASATIEHETIYTELKAHSLPGKFDDMASESAVPMVIMVD